MLADTQVDSEMEAALRPYVIVKFQEAGVVVARESRQICMRAVAAAMTGANFPST